MMRASTSAFTVASKIASAVMFLNSTRDTCDGDGDDSDDDDDDDRDVDGRNFWRP